MPVSFMLWFINDLCQPQVKDRSRPILQDKPGHSVRVVRIPMIHGFVVLKGSQINPNVAKACPKRALKDRARYGTYIDENNCLSADVLLSSPSAAASFVGGASLSGNFKWKDENGVTLGQLEGSDKAN
jgi:hypothetical protein